MCRYNKREQKTIYHLFTLYRGGWMYMYIIIWSHFVPLKGIKFLLKALVIVRIILNVIVQLWCTFTPSCIGIKQILNKTNYDCYVITSYFWISKCACFFGCLIVFNATFNNISVILWWSVLLVDETGRPGENHQPLAHDWLA